MATVDAMPLNELIRRRICPEVVWGLNFGVLQSTRAHCKQGHIKQHKSQMLYIGHTLHIDTVFIYTQ